LPALGSGTGLAWLTVGQGGGDVHDTNRSIPDGRVYDAARPGTRALNVNRGIQHHGPPLVERDPIVSAVRTEPYDIHLLDVTLDTIFKSR
jgi:hypothetical protein